MSDLLKRSKPDPALLDLAIASGAVLTGKPDGSEDVTVVFSIEAWRKFNVNLYAAGSTVPSTTEDYDLRYLRAAYEALKYHEAQTRPIDNTTNVLRSLKFRLEDRAEVKKDRLEL